MHLSRRYGLMMVALVSLFVLAVGNGVAQTEEQKQSPKQAQPQTAAPASKERSLNVIRIDVRGNRIINTNTILNNIKTRIGAELNQQMINDDVKRLYGTGFFQDIRIDIEEAAAGVRLIVVVDEKPVIRRVVIEGNVLLKEREIRKELGFVEGQTLDEFSINEGVNKLKDRYAGKGFRFAKVRYRVETDRVTKEATVFVTVEEGVKYRINQVTFEGVKSFKERRLKKLIKTKPRALWLLRFGRFKEEKFKEDLDRLAAFYQSQGFLDARAAHEFGYDERNGKIKIVVKIDEGKRYYAGRVDLKGAKVVPESEIWQRLNMLPGTVFSQQGLAEEMKTIRDYYYRYGYMNVQIAPTVNLNRDTQKVDVMYQIDEGDLYFVDKVKIRGNTKTKDIVIRRELRIRPGEKFDGDAVDKSKQRLENLGFFEEVSYDTEPASAPNRRDIVFKVKEKRTGELSFGAGVSSIDQFVGFAEIAQRNFDLLNWPRFTGAGQSIALKGRWGTITRDFEFSFDEPYLFNKPISFGLDVYDVRTENRNVDWREERMGIGTTFGKALTDFLSTGIGYKIERVRLFDIESDAAPDVLLFSGTNLLSRLRIFLNRDTRNSVFFPTKGSVAGVSGELIGSFLGGDQDYYIFQANATKYWSFGGGKHVIETRIRGGVTDDIGSEKVPVFDRFFAGGFGTVRGYNFRRVGPIEGGSAIGGNTMAIVNLEYTFPLPYLDNFKGAVFIDAGDIESESYKLDFGEFRVSIGPGVKINTPIGPLAFYYGLPIVNRDIEDRNGRFEFSLSRSF
ncbi:MAG: outer membrane protein assembly factor BamA [Omnitrophica bacterium RIFCSPHIGHO2_02_FULL_46_11]|nr:MAG: outer membrane protein assembly factor BamA [Omnitrophica bacterium RIFCSPHIGHO2_02_FULL_46_11]OGW87912.1 MAG: outer membrane protein assembly factor BamA [Omnitrophica bacterium RIFCSPLOWO2_01_FULL_45_10b]